MIELKSLRSCLVGYDATALDHLQPKNDVKIFFANKSPSYGEHDHVMKEISGILFDGINNPPHYDLTLDKKGDRLNAVLNVLINNNEFIFYLSKIDDKWFLSKIEIPVYRKRGNSYISVNRDVIEYNPDDPEYIYRELGCRLIGCIQVNSKGISR